MTSTPEPTPETTPAYEDGLALGRRMRSERDRGVYDYDCRWDLADAAKVSAAYFADFRRGLDDGLDAER